MSSSLSPLSIAPPTHEPSHDLENMPKTACSLSSGWERLDKWASWGRLTSLPTLATHVTSRSTPVRRPNHRTQFASSRDETGYRSGGSKHKDLVLGLAGKKWDFFDASAKPEIRKIVSAIRPAGGRLLSAWAGKTGRLGNRRFRRRRICLRRSSRRQQSICGHPANCRWAVSQTGRTIT